jgi:hypothetical protein
MKKLILKSPAACEMLSLTEKLFGHDRKLVVDGEVFGNYRVQAESSFTAAHGNAFGIPPAKIVHSRRMGTGR